MRYWGDAKAFLVENIIVYTIAFLGALLYDFLYTFFYSLNMLSESHPYGFGRVQIGLVVFFGMMLFRSLSKFRYYE